MGEDRHYSTDGPICPYCSHRHRADEPFYFDEDMVAMDCESCDRDFTCEVFTQTSWTTRARDGETSHG